MKAKIVLIVICFLVAMLYVTYKIDTLGNGVQEDSDMENILDGRYNIVVDPDFSYEGE